MMFYPLSKCFRVWCVVSMLVISFLWPSGQLFALNPVYFADQNLKEAVEDALGIVDPTSTDMAWLEHLDASGRDIADLAGLENANNLTSLVLTANDITDITVIGYLSHLETLNLHGNPVHDLAPLATLHDLKNLNLRSTQVNDLYPLWSLTQLETLDLYYTSVQNVVWLSELTQLKHLDLYCTDVSDITSLATLVNLEYLSMSLCPVEDISVLSAMANLRTVLLERTGARDISSLRQLTHLSWLDLRRTPLLLRAYCSDLSVIEANNPGIELRYDLPPTGENPLDVELYCDVDFSGLVTYADYWSYIPEFGPGVGGTVITVDDDGPADYSTIQEAINASVDGDVIRVMPGYYSGEGNYNLDFGAGLAAGQTRTITVCGSNANDPNVVLDTVIDAQEQGSVFHLDRGEGPGCLIAGLTITGGNARYGAGIYCGNGASPTISHCVIAGNTGLGFTANSSAGGGIYYSGTGFIGDCVIAYNYANLGGGGLYAADEGEVIVANCTFVHNCAPIGGGCYLSCAISYMAGCMFFDNESLGTAYHQGGGGLYSNRRHVELDGCYFEGNRATHGGAVRCSGNQRDSVMRNCTFFDNTATGKGGAVYCEAGQFEIKDCIVGDNSAEYGGGLYIPLFGYVYFHETGYVSRCWLYGNRAWQDGGAVYVSGGREDIFWKEGYQWTEWCWIDNCEIKGNRADRYGGGIYVDYPDTQIRNCTMAGNLSIQDQGGAIYCAEQTEPEIANNIITDTLGVAVTVSDYAQPSICYNDFWNNMDGNHEGLGQPGAGNLYVNPLYEYPGQWEGDLSTAVGRWNARWHSGRFALTENSPCIDAGDNYWVRDWETDIDSRYRIRNRVVDIGAHEFRTPGAIPIFDPDSDDLGDVPYFHAKPGDQRVYSGYEHYNTLQYRHEFFRSTLSWNGSNPVQCLRWEQTGAPVEDWSDAPLHISDFVMYLAKDTEGRLWLLGREENGWPEIVVNNLAEAVCFDDMFGIDAHLMAGRDDTPGAMVNAYYEIVDTNGQFAANYQTREGYLQVKKLYSWSTYLGNQPTYAYYDQSNGLVAEHWGYITGPNPPIVSWYYDHTLPYNEVDGYLNVDKCTVTANTDRSNPSDKLSVSLSGVDICSNDISEGSLAIVRLYNEGSLSPQKSYTFMAQGANANKFTNEYGTLRFDISKKKAKVSLKRIDLSGVSSPVLFEVEVGSYIESGMAYDGEILAQQENVDVINGKKKFIPMQLLSGNADALRVDTCKFKKGKKPNSDYLKIQGALAVQDPSVNMAEQDVTVNWGSYSVVIPAQDIYQVGSAKKSKYKYKKPKGTDSSIASAIFDLKKCTFKIIIKNALIGDQGASVDLHMRFGSFDETITTSPRIL